MRRVLIKTTPGPGAGIKVGLCKTAVLASGVPKAPLESGQDLLLERISSLAGFLDVFTHSRTMKVVLVTVGLDAFFNNVTADTALNCLWPEHE